MIISNHIYLYIDSIWLRIFQSNVISFLLLIKVDWTAGWSCQREFLIELHRNLICKFRIKFDRKNSINFWIELHTTFQWTKSRLNLIAISLIIFFQRGSVVCRESSAILREFKKPKQIGVFSLEMSEITLYTSRYLSIFGWSQSNRMRFLNMFLSTSFKIIISDLSVFVGM